MSEPRRVARTGAPDTGPAILERIRSLAMRPDGLFRMHEKQPAFYAQARRRFGSWPAAVRAAGLDYAAIVNAAQRRATATRRRRRRQRRPPPGH
jgi:hypothetical protein